MYVWSHTYSKSMDQPSKVANPARGQLNRENEKITISLSAFAPENLVSRDRFGIPVPRQPAHHPDTQGEFTYGIAPEFRGGVHLLILKPPDAVGSVPSLSGHVIAYRWRSLPKVRRHRASKSQGSSGRVLPWQVTMGPINVRLSFPHPLLI